MGRLGNRVRELREARKEKLRAVARAVEIDPTQLSYIERGIVGCSDVRKLRLAEHFGVGVQDLFFQPLVESNSTEEAIPA